MRILPGLKTKFMGEKRCLSCHANWRSEYKKVLHQIGPFSTVRQIQHMFVTGVMFTVMVFLFEVRNIRVEAVGTDVM